jgi:hypothetical protein
VYGLAVVILRRTFDHREGIMIVNDRQGSQIATGSYAEE